MRFKTRRNMCGVIFPLLFGLCLSAGVVNAADKPNIVVIWGDDIGRDNLSVFTKGMMGYQTPNINRIANEGILFTDAYADQSCTADARPSSRASPRSARG